MELKQGDIVTVKFENIKASNVFILVYKIIRSNGKEIGLLKHPLAPDILVERPMDELNIVALQSKDSVERSLGFVRANQTYLDCNSRADLYALCQSFVVVRKLTTRQKSTLSMLGGFIAITKLQDDINTAMALISKNAAILDEFNAMWYNNFSGLFKRNQPITSKKQRQAIFNMAGFVLAELENTVVFK